VLRLLLLATAVASIGACGDSVPPLQTAKPGVVFTFPIDGQNDVPTGARIVVSFSDPVTKSALGPCTATTGAFCIVGPNGPVDAMPTVSDDGKAVSYGGGLEPGTTYQVFARSQLAPTAENLPESGTPLFSFTTRIARPRAAPPTLVSVNGGDPTKIGSSFRPMFEATTLRLLFSEPLDPRSIKMGAGFFELLNSAGSAVTANIVSDGIHVSIDPKDDLMPGQSYLLRVGNQIVDLGGQALATTTLMFSPTLSRTATPVVQSMKPADATFKTRSGAESNSIVIDKPLIGRETSQMLPFILNAEIGDPKALPDHAIGFTIRRGQRLASSGLSIKLGGQIPAGLDTGDVEIELLTDATGRLYRNPYQSPDQRPENDRAPLYVDLSMDVAVFAKDPTGNAVLTQTILGLQGTGTAVATDGQLVIETVASMELGLLGVTQAPTNFVLVLATKGPGDAPPADTEAPTLIASSPGQSDEGAVDAGVDLVFSEPIDLERARAGGIRLEDTVAGPIETVIESHGSSVVLRPLVPLPYAKIYRVVFTDVADVAGNKATISNLSFTTPVLQSTGVPAAVLAIHPGAPCVLAGGTAASPGRCDGGKTGDDLYHPFTLAKNDPITVTFSEPIRRTSVTRGTACGQGSFRVEEVDGAGNCTAVVAGTLMTSDRTLTFVADEPWSDTKKYKLSLISGGNGACDAGELCDPGGAMSFDPLNGMQGGDSGGNPLVIPFTGAAPTGGTFLVTSANPFTDYNGSGGIDSSEQKRAENRAKMRITNVTGFAGATFTGNTCDAMPVNNKEGCMYLLGAMPVEMGEVSTTCPLPGGATAASCVPVTMGPQAMYATSLTMAADTGTIIGTINTDTNVSVMRIREPSGGPAMGYIVDNGGTPKMVAQLELYMDAPDMSIVLSSHDLHSKPLSVSLEGPLTFQDNGQIAIALTNTADLTVDVAISGPISGHVTMIIPKGEMHLQLVSPAPRGVSL